MKKTKDTRESLWKRQRKQRGFDDRELWNLDYTIAKFVLPRLIAFRDTMCSGCPASLTEKKWKKILNEIIWGMDYIVNDKLNPKTFRKDEDRCDAAMKLFGEWFRGMWD